MPIIPLILTIAAIAAYFVQGWRLAGSAPVFVGAAAHVLALGAQLYDLPQLQLTTVLSAFMVATLMICWRSLVAAILRRLLLLFTALAAAMALWEPAAAVAALSVHSVLALAVYALSAAAFLLCLDLRLVERRLRRQPQAAAQALLAREQQYFNYVCFSFVLLTLTLASGMIAAVAAGETMFSLTHKQLFAYLTWLVLLALLVGRRLAGWRGARAQRWLFTGYAFLLLSYVGSTAVAQLVLGGE